HTVAAAGAIVTGRTVDVEPLLAAQDQRLGNRHGKLVRKFAVGAFTGGEQRVVVEMAARHGAFGDGAGGAAVGEEIAGPQRNVLRLIVHVLSAGGQQEEGEDEETNPSLTVGAPIRAATVRERLANF